jgi:hypothetical protein
MTPVKVPASCADAAGTQKTEAAHANAVRCSFDLPDFSTAILLGVQVIALGSPRLRGAPLQISLLVWFFGFAACWAADAAVR